MSVKKREADKEIYTIFKGSPKKKAKSNKKPRAKWSKEETSLLIEKLNDGERVSDLLHYFPKKSKQQVHSKVSNLKQKKLVSVQRESIAPSFLAALANHLRVKLSPNRLKVPTLQGIRDIEEPQKKISGGMPILEVSII